MPVPLRPDASHVKSTTNAAHSAQKKAMDMLARQEISHSFSFKRFFNSYHAKTLSPDTVTERIIKAIENQKETINALTFSNTDEIRRQAKDSALRWKSGDMLGPLDGVPVTVKDEMDALPYPTTCGASFFLEKGEAKSDSTVVERLRAAGCILIGKSLMHELGIGVVGDNRSYGLGRNPYNLAHHTGGSSAGSAAAVAAQLCPIAIGADAGGSIRIPAALCGQVGLKPTWARVSEHGVAPLCWSVGHVGPIAASVDDAAAAYLAIAGADAQDPWTSMQPPVTLDGYEKTKDLSDLRFGIYDDWFDHADPEIVEKCRESLLCLTGHGAIETSIQLKDLELKRVAHNVITITEMYRGVGEYVAAHPDRFSHTTRMGLNLAKCFTADDSLRAQQVRTLAFEEMNRLFDKVAIIVTPTTATTAPRINLRALPHGEQNLPLMTKLMRFITLANLVGVPAITIPVGYDHHGMPIGLQIMARHWNEAVLFRVAKTLEASVEKRLAEERYNVFCEQD